MTPEERKAYESRIARARADVDQYLMMIRPVICALDAQELHEIQNIINSLIDHGKTCPTVACKRYVILAMFADIGSSCAIIANAEAKLEHVSAAGHGGGQ